MGLRPGLSHLRSTRRRTPLLAASIQLASPTRRDKIANAHQPPRPIREQPVEAPHLGVAFDALGERENGTARLEEAVAAYRAALQEYKRDRVPLQWAAIQDD